MKSYLFFAIALSLVLGAGCASSNPAAEKPVATEAAKPALAELVMTRTLKASPAKVWKSWTDPKAIKRWWGPKDFTSPTAKIDLREGGKYLLSMKGPDGKVYYSTGIYSKVDPNKSFEASDSFADENGNIVPASYYGMQGDIPTTMQMKVSLEEQAGGNTLMTVTQSGVPTGEMLEMSRTGWNQSFDKLEAALKKK